LETKSGEEYTGILKQVTDSWIELVGVNAKPMRIATADIRERHTSEVSLMPEGFGSGADAGGVHGRLIGVSRGSQAAESGGEGRARDAGCDQPLAKPITLAPRSWRTR